MYNIQRNFIENILMEAGIDNINFSKILIKIIYRYKNNNLSLIFLDLDRIKNINFIKNNILKIKKRKAIQF